MDSIKEAKQVLDKFLKDNVVYDEYYNTSDGTNNPCENTTFEEAITYCGFCWSDKWYEINNKFFDLLHTNYLHLINIPLLDVLTVTDKVPLEDAAIKILKKLDIYKQTIDQLKGFNPNHCTIEFLYDFIGYYISIYKQQELQRFFSTFEVPLTAPIDLSHILTNPNNVRLDNE